MASGMVTCMEMACRKGSVAWVHAQEAQAIQAQQPHQDAVVRVHFLRTGLSGIISVAACKEISSRTDPYT